MGTNQSRCNGGEIKPMTKTFCDICGGEIDPKEIGQDGMSYSEYTSLDTKFKISVAVSAVKKEDKKVFCSMCALNLLKEASAF